MRTPKLAVAVIALAATFTSFANAQTKPTITVSEPVSVSKASNVVVVRDEVGKVTCYVAESKTNAAIPVGISCVKD